MNCLKKLWRLIPHKHKWKNQMLKGEKEHGPNPTKRNCTRCGYEQWLSYLGWIDSPEEKIRKLK